MFKLTKLVITECFYRCWLSRIPFYVAFLAPVCIVLLVNTVVFVLVIRQIIRRSSKKLTKTDSSSTAARLRGAISLVVLLGLTWVFAFLAVGNFGIAFHYLFALFNSLQGFFIFVFYCLLKKEAQQCWKKALPCFKSPYEKNISANTQSQGKQNWFALLRWKLHDRRHNDNICFFTENKHYTRHVLLYKISCSKWLWTEI